MKPSRPAFRQRRQALALLSLPALAAAATLPGCGGGTDRRRAQVRLVNASTGYERLDLRVDNELKHAEVRPGERGAYAEVDTDKPETTVFASGSPAPLLRFSPSYSADRWTTVLVYGRVGALRQLVLDDNRGEPEANRALLRVVNAAFDAGPLDLYLTADGDELVSAVPLQAAAAYGAVGDWQTVDSGTWRLRATAAGSKTDVRLDVRGIVLGSRALVSLVLRSTPGGVLVDGLWLVQRGGVSTLANPQARVRLAALVADSASVGADIGSVNLARGVGAPAVGEYRRVDVAGGPGGLAAAVQVNGGALAPLPLALQPGRDYTLLVSGPAAAARVALIDDDNRLLIDSGRAQLRLVNGLADAGTAVAMTLDFLPVADEVAPGAASPAVAVDATTTGRIAVTAPGAAAPLFVAIEQVLRANATHTVFVGGTAAAAVGILRRDR
jgi:hypothetical protein